MSVWRKSTHRKRRREKSMDEKVTVLEAARRLGVSRGRVYEFMRTGRLPAVRFGWQWAIDPADLERLERRPPGRPVTTGAGVRRRQRAAARAAARAAEQAAAQAAPQGSDQEPMSEPAVDGSQQEGA
jgi:excisionase family DNA binding protein